jgi:hypothetical protein
MSENRREFTRVHVPIDAELQLEDRVVTAQVTDVSMIGAYLAGCEAIPAGTKCRVVVFLDGRTGRTRIEADGRVARSSAAGIGVEFEDLVGLDSYWHLRSLVVYNAKDPDAAEREVDEHLGIRRRE